MMVAERALRAALSRTDLHVRRQAPIGSDVADFVLHQVTRGPKQETRMHAEAVGTSIEARAASPAPPALPL